MNMKQMIFISLFVFFVRLLNAQEFNEYRGVDRLVLSIPDSQTNSTDSIAGYVKSHFDGDLNKIRAIYVWVTTNLKYDKDSSNIINSDINPGARITAALRRRKGVCENFAAIFNDICLKTGLTSMVINGYTKQGGAVDKTGHSWCAVFANKNWYLCDPTWDAGNGMYSKYFMIQPIEFIESHMPYDPLWQLLNYPITHEQFYNGRIFNKTDTPYFNFSDSVTAYSHMDSLHKLQSTALRIQNYGIYNPRVKDNYNYIKMNIEMINQDTDVNLYNSSVADLNEVTAILNNFIEYRNKQFTPEKTDSELQALLDGVDQKIDSSLKKLDQVDKSKATLTLGTDEIRNRLNVLLGKIKDQKLFLNRYLTTTKNDRKSLFY